ncbi:proline-rich transmembrane protein 1-like [Ruditapes philippinarum]|uniref:proline-rich transmembrane protein 1-like n=1 Tax=Ruditapes philippinarum TaxID=129788 RepID=UPI00295C0FF8|nr:proline-rich transmembrane protein 1-like [Ruditapes philippinarum]
MAEGTGSDLPEDYYTDKHVTFEANDVPLYQPVIPLSQRGYGQQTCPVQPAYGHNTETIDVNQPQTANIIIQQLPPDCLMESVLACLFCFCPTGIFAIFFACKANDLANSGDYAGTKRMSEYARMLTMLSVTIGISLLLVMVLLELQYLDFNYR